MSKLIGVRVNRWSEVVYCDPGALGLDLFDRATSISDKSIRRKHSMLRFSRFLEPFFDRIEAKNYDKRTDFEKALLGFATSEYSDFMGGIEKSGDYNDDIGATLKELLEKFVSTQTW